MNTSLINAYTHCPICGSSDYAFSEGARVCGACGHRDFNNPITAVAAFILDGQDRVLLIRRAKDPACGKLAPPGGFVDAGESLEQAIQREIAEEVGLEAVDFNYLSSYPNTYVYGGRGRPVCDVFFVARTKSLDVTLQHDEATDWFLHPLHEIDPADMAFDSMRHALKVLQKAR